VIWARQEAKSFCGRDWTDGITLIGFDNLAFFEKTEAEPNHPISGSKP
jgi:hypothetical protein